MAMKGKPNLAGFDASQNPDAAAFIGGGSATIADAHSVTVPATFMPANDRVNKTIRISKALENKLKREALKRSEKTGSRISESDLIEQALLAFFNK